MRRYRFVVLASHPIQYRSPLYRHLSAQPWLDLEVWYGDTYGVTPRRSDWGVENFTWDGDLLSGYRHRFLRNSSPRPNPGTRLGKINLGLPGDLRRARPEAVWISGYNGFHQWLSFLSSARWRVPIVYSSDSNHLAEPSGLKRRVKHAIVERIYRRVAAILVTGATNDLHYAAYGVPESRRFRCPWAVDNDAFSRAADEAWPGREDVRRGWGVAPGSDVALFVGRLIVSKRPADLVALAERFPDLHAVFAGSGPLEKDLKDQTARRIPARATFLGFQNQAALPGIYAAADLLVLPSAYEPWGLVVNEALASGLPVVASDRVGAAYDLVPESLRFPVGDVGGMARTVERWRAERPSGGDPRVESRRGVAGFSFESDAAGIREALASILD
jgi:glycosyltransferase involved in cell wall biosynthesis